MPPQLAKFGEVALDFLFPKWCVGCRHRGDLICPVCRSSIVRISTPVCPRCGRPQISEILCPVCVSWSVAIDAIRAPFRFEGVIRQAVYELKYHNIRALALPLARLINDYLISSPLPGEILVPVPLHRKRLRERGYNQSGLLARELGKLANLPVVDDCLVRQKYTSAQARTEAVAERHSNVEDAFVCSNSDVRGKTVLLIDDVTTSGATLNAGAIALKDAGASSVWGLALAREI